MDASLIARFALITHRMYAHVMGAVINNAERIIKKIQEVAESHWITVFTGRLTAWHRLTIACCLFSVGVVSTLVLSRATGHFFPSIDMAVIVLIAIYAGPVYGIISGVSITLIEDYLFIGGIGQILENSESVERFFILTILTIIVSVLTNSIRIGYAKTVESQREAERARGEAEKATKFKTAFLATVSHEIRTPLNGIIGLSDVLRKSNLSEKDQNMVEAVHESGRTLLKIINDILDYSKIESNNLTLHSKAIYISDYIGKLASPCL